MRIKSSHSFELLKDIQSPSFTRVLKAGELISGYWIKTWFKFIDERTMNEWFKFREDIPCYHCSNKAIDASEVLGKYSQSKS
jgi:hypothetical protein